VAVAAVGEYASLLGFSKERVRDICLALDEAVMNAIALGYGGQNDELNVTMSGTGHGIRLTVSSKGLPLDESQLPQYDPSRLGEGDTTGLGTHLIRRLVDQVSFSVKEGGEREVSMVALLPLDLSVVRDKSAGTAPEWPAVAKSLPPQVLRRAVPDDADAISRLALRSHGTVLFDERIYYPASVRQMLETGEMISVVSEVEGVGVTGHGALLHLEAGVRELTFGFVDARHQGKGCSWGLADCLMQIAAELGVRAVLASAVTSHVRSQRSALHAGLRECALLIAAGPAASVWSEGNADTIGVVPSRIADLVFVRCLGETNLSPLYLPIRHKRMIESIFVNIGLCHPPDSVTSHGTALPTTPTILEFKSDFKEGWAFITVDEPGRDALAQIESHLDASRTRGIPLTVLLLPLDNPHTPDLCDAAEKLGFFFAGIGPSQKGRMNLALQFLWDVEPEFQAIHVYTEFARELLDYVCACAVKDEPALRDVGVS
jgi:anti-sigma regulatory factor (Ser/Thr protein kinase)